MATIQKEKAIALEFQHLLNRFVSEEKIPGTILSVFAEQPKGISWTGSAGNLRPEQPYFLTSVAKLHLTALVLKLRVRGLLKLEDPIIKYLPEEICQRLLVMGKNDYSKQIQIAHLLSHRSGLPDYFDVKFKNGESLKSNLFSGSDQSWTFEELISGIKKIKPGFKPGQKNKIHYADTNFQLLGKIIERITGQPLNKAIEDFHIKPLDLKQTYFFSDIKDRTPAPFYFKEKALMLPKAMTSFGPVGGTVSTSHDNMVFYKSFIHGQLFPEEDIEKLQLWQPVGKGLFYGNGILKFDKPFTFMPFSTKELFIGHPGTSGAFAFYQPEKKVFLTGTTNQASDPFLIYKLLIKVMKIIREA